VVTKGIDRTAKFFNRMAAAIFIAALIIGSSTVTFGPKLYDVPVFGGLMFATAAILGFWLLLGILRSGWL
jgi:ubiquinone biosynthesis protein